jgi:Methyltransferase domain
MNEAEIRQRKAEVEAQFGPWTGDNVPLGYGINTLPHHVVPQFQIRRILQTIADLSTKPWGQLRILDLGSLNGTHALELASQGAQVVGIEGRESGNAHARFAAEALGLTNVSFFTDDVRNLSEEKYGKFDVVLCSGLLYHLPGVDACRFLSSVAQVCKHLTIIDTHVGLREQASISWEGRSYHGFLFGEHVKDDSASVKAGRTWSSLDNDTSFWFTKASLLDLLRDVGFTCVFEVLRPQGFAIYSDRLTIAATIGNRQRSYMSPELEQTPEPDWREHSDGIFPAQRMPPTPIRSLQRRIAGLRHKLGF